MLTTFPVREDDRLRRRATRLLRVASTRPCVYDSDGQPPECPKEWPSQPWNWCGSCLARAVTKT